MKEDNELIAEFFGFELDRRPDSFDQNKFRENWICKGNPFNNYRDKETRYWYTKEQLLFHTSWDWLMPVVEKIEVLNKRPFRIEETTTTTSLNVEVITDSLGGYISFNKPTKIESVYAVCVDFIKQFNQNKP